MVLSARTDNDLRVAAARFELLAELGGVLVVVGLVAEVILAYSFPLGDSLFERWGSVATNGFIAVGVAAEVLFSRKARARAEELQNRSDRKIVELELKVAETELRAAEALRAGIAEAKAHATNEAIVFSQVF